MKIEDLRIDTSFVEVRHHSIEIGDVVETQDGQLALVVWADEAGRPYCGNPGYNGLLYFCNGQSCTTWQRFPRVRKVSATLVVKSLAAGG